VTTRVDADLTRLPEVGLAVAVHGAGLDEVRALAAGCRGCDLWERATQTVFGEGSTDSRVMLVGEQPGDQEDLAGQPFVGPAGKVLDKALEEAGIDRERAFVTNVVKHFKWRPSGKRRLHERPNARQIRACRPWLDAELALVRPAALVLLGATAAKSIIGPDVRVSEAAEPLESDLAPLVLATIHPSAVLRSVDSEAREVAFRRLVGDLHLVADWIRSNGRGPPDA
jgi:uracil-DNA glycosylase family protein